MKPALAVCLFAVERVRTVVLALLLVVALKLAWAFVAQGLS